MFPSTAAKKCTKTRDAPAQLLICQSKPKSFFCRSLYRRRLRCFQSSLLSFDGRRHSATGFSANVVVAETSYEMLDVLINITVLIFRVKKKKKKEVFRGSIFENTRKNLKAKSRTCGCSRP